MRLLCSSLRALADAVRDLLQGRGVRDCACCDQRAGPFSWANSLILPQISSTMAWFMLAMVLYPDVQKKAQEELDAVVGRDRTPTF